MTMEFDLVVVGGGPGGYVAAIRSAQLGLKTALVEEKHLGGICLNWGCIPTKALLKGADVAHTLSEAGRFGFDITRNGFDIAQLVKYSRDVSGRLSGGVAYLMQKHGVTVIDGRGRLNGKGRLSVSGADVELDVLAPHIILATGARPRSLPGVQPDGEHIVSYFEAMVPETLPASLLVIGSGAIGVEFSSLYNDLGTEVTLVELESNIMPVEDPEISEFARKQFERRGINVKTDTSVSAVEVTPAGVQCTLQSEGGDTETVLVERVILSAGVQGNIEDLGLEQAGVETERSFITTDAWGKTSAVGVYAIGDVAGPLVWRTRPVTRAFSVLKK